jgi:hypothetical protein
MHSHGVLHLMTAIKTDSIKHEVATVCVCNLLPSTSPALISERCLYWKVWVETVTEVCNQYSPHIIEK